VILLDDAQSTDKAPTSRLYKNPIACITAIRPEEVDAAIIEIEDALTAGQFVVVALSYELGEVLQGLPYRPSATPLIRAYRFERVECLSQQQASAWIEQQISPLDLTPQSLNTPDMAGLLSSTVQSSPTQFSQEIEKIHRLIETGDTYQVNHTFRITGEIYGDPLALYARLRERQPSRFGAFINTEQGAILSISPEWFLSCHGQTLMARPMKGTLSAKNQDAGRLADDPKNRTENLMIVDLIRNDLGRISQTGTVRVPALFEVEQFGDLYQMTSTVMSEIKPGIGLKDLLIATFPCGSVTGAPKRRTMEIIQSLESSARGLYCGAIGWFDPPEPEVRHHSPLGNFAMSVAIRTLEVSPSRRFTLGVGAGITIDSESASEWQECLLKAEFLTHLPSPIGLIETMRVENGQLPRFNAHLNRLQASAQALGLLFDRTAAEHQIHDFLSKTLLSNTERHSVFRLRLQLNPAQPRDASGALDAPTDLTDPNGSRVPNALDITLTPLAPLHGAQKIFWAHDLLGESAARIDSTAPLFRHKTTSRELYDRAWRAAEQHGGFDALFINERGEVTEGGRSTLFIRRAGEWLTPALTCGLLPGVMRAEILADPIWQAREAVISVADVMNAEALIVVNALRGVIVVDRAKSLEVPVTQI